MAVKLARIGFRLAILTAVVALGFYIGRPLYWKVSATLQEIKEKDYTNEAVKHGISDLMLEAQKLGGWGRDEPADMKVGQALDAKKSDAEKLVETQTIDSKAGDTEKVVKPTDDGADETKAVLSVADDVSKSRRLTRRLMQR